MSSCLCMPLWSSLKAEMISPFMFIFLPSMHIKRKKSYHRALQIVDTQKKVADIQNFLIGGRRVFDSFQFRIVELLLYTEYMTSSALASSTCILNTLLYLVYLAVLPSTSWTCFLNREVNSQRAKDAHSRSQSWWVLELDNHSKDESGRLLSGDREASGSMLLIIPEWKDSSFGTHHVNLFFIVDIL